MDGRLARTAGTGTALGVVLAVVASVPSRWYGVTRTGAYVFDPPAFSPLWIERVLVPVVGLLAGGLLAAGLAALVVRDRAVAGRLRRWGGYAAVAGLVVVDVSAFVVSLLDGSAAVTGALLLLVTLLVALAGLAVAAPALVTTGVGYARTDRPAVGYVLVAGPVLSVLALGVLWLDLLALGSLPVVVPFALAFLGVGHELWIRAEPLSEPEGEEEDDGALDRGPDDAAR